MNTDVLHNGQGGSQMDKPRHPNVVRTWKVERIRKPATPTKQQQVRRVKKSK
jgi:hypothetical protein